MTKEFNNEHCPKCNNVMIKFIRPKSDMSGFYWEYICECGYKEIRDYNIAEV